jgi:hypothetical protein
MLRIPHCLDNRLTVNSEILATCSSTYSPVLTSQEAHSVSIKQSYPRNRPCRHRELWISVRRWVNPRDTAGLEGFGKLHREITSDSGACSTVPQPTILLRVSFHLATLAVAIIQAYSMYDRISMEREAFDETIIGRVNSVAWVRERTIPTERPPLEGEKSDKFCG